LLVVCGRRFDAVSGAGVWVSKTVIEQGKEDERERAHIFMLRATGSQNVDVWKDKHIALRLTH
jgi:hypothetical protein